VAKNAEGFVLPLTDAAVALSNPALGTNVVNPDGTGGLFTSTVGLGLETLTPSGGGVTGTPYALQIVDNVVASVTIVPTPATLTVAPAAAH